MRTDDVHICEQFHDGPYVLCEDPAVGVRGNI